MFLLLAFLPVFDPLEEVFVVLAELVDRLLEVLDLLFELPFLGDALLYGLGEQILRVGWGIVQLLRLIGP